MRATWQAASTNIGSVLDRLLSKPECFLLVSMGLALCIFAADLFLPPAYAVEFLYVPIVMLGLGTKSDRALLVTAASVTALCILGYALTLMGADGDDPSLFNRVLFIGTIWGTVLLGFAFAQGNPTRASGIVSDRIDRQPIDQDRLHANEMKAIGRRTSGIAHEFNNLLTVVVGNLEMIEASARLKARDRVLLSETQEAARHGAKLVQRLLAFGRNTELKPSIADADRPAFDFTGLLRRSLGDGSAAGPDPTRLGDVTAMANGETILVVENDAAIRRSTVTSLRTLGYRVVETVSPTDALVALKEMPDIDLLFGDVIISGDMTGTDFARQLRKDYPAIRFLFTSSHADWNRLEQEPLNGMAWLRKPYALTEMAWELRRVFGDMRISR